ncbi:hypothetical protein C8R46DRAFT_1098186 [Mycena filopes]|nr:hypothetical protein C8R46DRAFT_1098186 [Mycena filopes]
MTRLDLEEFPIGAKAGDNPLHIARRQFVPSSSKSASCCRSTVTDTPSSVLRPTNYPLIGLTQWAPVPFSSPSTSNTNPYCREFFSAHYASRARPRSVIGLDILRRRCQLKTPRDPTAGCHPETRKESLKILYEWASETSTGSGGLFWLQGPAGVGKSAILRTLVQQIGHLGAAFFFDRQSSPERNATTLFCALAYQLASNIPSLRAPISSAVRKNTSIVRDTMDIQLQELILEPCRRVILLHPLVLVIDGIDEFKSDEQRDILRLLGNAVQNLPSRLRIIIATRQLELLPGSWCSLHVEASFKDVRSYLWVELARIQEFNFTTTQWFSPHVLDFLVDASAGSFLYASTLIKFLGDADFAIAKRLSAVQNFPLVHLNSSVDKLYVQILMTVPMASRQSLLAILHVLTTEAFADLPLYHLEQLLRTKPGRLRRILRRLRAVLNIPTSDGGHITVLDSSFIDFLVDPVRSGPFCVVGIQHSVRLVRRMLKSLAYEHQDPHINRAGHIAWTHLRTMVDFVTSVYPSPDFVPLILRINPDFCFGTLTTFDELGSKMLVWLNNMHPRPVEVIDIWEDYAYMAFFHSTVSDFDFDEEESDVPTDSEVALQQQILLRQPELIRLLRFSMVLPALTPLFQFRTLLGASWNQLRQSVVLALRPVFGRNSAALTQLWTSLQNPRFARTIYPWASIFRNLAYQSIRIAKGTHAGTLPIELMGYWLEWGRYVRSSPPSSEVLRELSTFVPRDDSEYGLSTENEIYDVLKWFKSTPNVPAEEMLRWTNYLALGTQCERDYAYGMRWTSWRGLEWYEVAS